MDRVALSIGKITIYWYALFVAIGMLTAIILIMKECKRHKFNMDFVTNLVFYALLFGIIGTRLYYVLFNLDYYLKDPMEILRVWNGGLAIHGAIITGITVIYIYTKKYKVNTVKFLDITAVGFIAAQMIGRWGNFFNQEAFGPVVAKATLEKFMIPNFIIKGMLIDGVYHHPTFLYESVWCFLGLIILLFLRRRKYAKIGEMTGFYLMWYSFERFFVEQLRQDSLMLGNLKVAQLVSIIMFISGIIFIIRARKGSKFDNLYNVEEKDETRF